MNSGSVGSDKEDFSFPNNIFRWFCTVEKDKLVCDEKTQQLKG